MRDVEAVEMVGATVSDTTCIHFGFLRMRYTM